eukprot:2684577-Pleurochrysis_carterae.AAC.2
MVRFQPQKAGAHNYLSIDGFIEQVPTSTHSSCESYRKVVGGNVTAQHTFRPPMHFNGLIRSRARGPLASSGARANACRRLPPAPPPRRHRTQRALHGTNGAFAPEFAAKRHTRDVSQ